MKNSNHSILSSIVLPLAAAWLLSSVPGGARVNQLRGTVWELGYLGNRSTYQIKTTSGKLVTVFAQNERRTSEALIDWNDEVFVSWSADAAVLLLT